MHEHVYVNSDWSGLKLFFFFLTNIQVPLCIVWYFSFFFMCFLSFACMMLTWLWGAFGVSCCVYPLLHHWKLTKCWAVLHTCYYNFISIKGIFVERCQFCLLTIKEFCRLFWGAAALPFALGFYFIFSNMF